MIRPLSLTLLVALAACGIKGDPQPVPGDRKPGVSVTGTAEIGVTIRDVN